MAPILPGAAEGFSAPLIPTRTVPLRALRHLLQVRQAPTTTVTVAASPPPGNNSNDLSGGAIAGIVIASIVGLFLLIWILRSCTDLGAPPLERESLYYDIEPEHHHYHHGSHSHRDSYHSHARSYSGSRRPSEIREVRSSSRVVEPVPVIVRESGGHHHTRGPRQPEAVYIYENDRKRGRSRS